MGKTNKITFPFPFPPYDIQKELMSSIFARLQEGGVGIFESPTGTGKSLSIINSVLLWLKNYAPPNHQLLAGKTAGNSTCGNRSNNAAAAAVAVAAASSSSSGGGDDSSKEEKATEKSTDFDSDPDWAVDFESAAVRQLRDRQERAEQRWKARVAALLRNDDDEPRRKRARWARQQKRKQREKERRRRQREKSGGLTLDLEDVENVASAFSGSNAVSFLTPPPFAFFICVNFCRMVYSLVTLSIKQPHTIIFPNFSNTKQHNEHWTPCTGECVGGVSGKERLENRRRSGRRVFGGGLRQLRRNGRFGGEE